MDTSDFKIVNGVLIEYTGLADAVTLPSHVREIGPRVFSKNYKLKHVGFNVGLEKIGEEAFAFSGIETVTLPFTVTYIGKRAFANSAIRKMTIPNRMVELAGEVFVSCSKLEIAYVPDYCASDFIFAPNWEFPDNISPWFKNHPKGIRSFEEYNQQVQALEKQREETHRHWLQRQEWAARGRCQYCGGRFSGWPFSSFRYCLKCGSEKDY